MSPPPPHATKTPVVDNVFPNIQSSFVYHLKEYDTKIIDLADEPWDKQNCTNSQYGMKRKL